MNIWSTIIPLILPTIIDIIKSTVSRLLFKTKTLTVEEDIKLLQAEAEKIKALAEIDKLTQPVAQWVINFRAIFRYAFCLLILIVFVIFAFSPNIVSPEITSYVGDLVSGVTFFLIGHRTWLYIKNK